MLDPRLLRTFVAIVDTGSFTLAAARLHSTQSTVSQHLARLEQAAGHTLIDRSARPAVPTAAGERLIGYSRRLLTLHDEAIELLADPSGTSTIRIGLPDDLVTKRMSRRFSIFAQRYREHRLDVATGLSRDLVRRFRSGELDIVVAKEPAAARDAQASFAEPVAWFERDGEQSDLVEPVPLVTFPPGGLYRDLMIARMENQRRRWYVAFTGNSLPSVISAVEAGIGVSVLPVGAVQGHSLRVIEQLGAEHALSVSLYSWEKSGTIGALAQKMIEELSRRAQAGKFLIL